MLARIKAVQPGFDGGIGAPMTGQIEGDDARAVSCQRVQVAAPSRRASCEAVQQDQRRAAVFASFLVSETHVFDQHEPASHHEAPASFSRALSDPSNEPVSVLRTASHRWRCILTLLVRSVATSMTCKPPLSIPCRASLRNCSQLSALEYRPPYICTARRKSSPVGVPKSCSKCAG